MILFDRINLNYVKLLDYCQILDNFSVLRVRVSIMLEMITY